jgi:iron-sulfur cluster repair protein YtfE (RIC family)
MSTATPRRTAPGHLLDLPGQTHVAEGPLDLNGMYMAHHAFRRDLNRFAAAARNTPVDEVEVWRALAVRWSQFGAILHHHHTTEDDVLWPQLLEVADAEGRATLEAMEAEHEQIDPLLEACAAGFAAMARTPDAAVRARLADIAESARDTLSEHMRHEETGALPLVQDLLSAEGWERVEKAAGSGKGLADLLFLVPWVADGLTPAQLEMAFRSVGQGFRVLLALTRGRYERRERVAFRFGKDLPAPHPSQARGGSLQGGRF